MAELTEARLTGSVWRFGEQGKPAWCPAFRFLPGGGIGGYDHEHERRWELKGEQLLILAENGKVTWKFYASPGDDAALTLLGTYRYDRSFTGIGMLAEAEAPAAASATPAPAAASETGGKVGILVIGSAAPKILDETLALYDEDRFAVFLHLDAKADLAAYTGQMRNAAKLRVLERRVPIYWGGFSMVEATLALVEAALAEAEITRLILVSDDSCPIKPPAEIHAALMADGDRIASEKNGWREGWYAGFFYPDSPFSSLRDTFMHELRQVTPHDIAMLARLEALRARGKRKLPAVRFCRQWWALTRTSAEAILALSREDEHLTESFRFSLLPDETFFPSVYAIRFPEAAPKEIPTYADFANVPRHPNPWIYRTLDEIRGAPVGPDTLFIRKLPPGKPELVREVAAGWPQPAATPEPRRETAAPAGTGQTGVRLVVWDLDDTFWRGSLADGSVSYRQDVHETVVALSKRGILSSVCARTDAAPAQRLLEEHGIWPYLVFPSLAQAPQAPRLAAIVQAAGLAPRNVLFIDDNAMNRNEARHYLPELHVADESAVDGLLGNTLLQGDDDEEAARQRLHAAAEPAGESLPPDEAPALVEAASAAPAERLAERVYVRGAAALRAVAARLLPHAGAVLGTYNVTRDGKRLRLDHSAFLKLAFDGIGDAERDAAARIGYAPEDFSSPVAEAPGSFDACVLSFTDDANLGLYRHAATGLVLPFLETDGQPWENALTRDLPEHAAAQAALREDGWSYEAPAPHYFMEALSLLLAQLPENTALFFLLDPEVSADPAGNAQPIERYKALNRVIRVMTAGRPNTYLLNLADHAAQTGAALDEAAYVGAADAILGILRARTADAAPRERAA